MQVTVSKKVVRKDDFVEFVVARLLCSGLLDLNSSHLPSGR